MIPTFVTIRLSLAVRLYLSRYVSIHVYIVSTYQFRPRLHEKVQYIVRQLCPDLTLKILLLSFTRTSILAVSGGSQLAVILQSFWRRADRLRPSRILASVGLKDGLSAACLCLMPVLRGAATPYPANRMWPHALH